MNKTILALLISVLFITGCEKKAEDKPVVKLPDSKPGETKLFKGMCNIVSDTLTMKECSTQRNFQIASDGNITQLKEVSETVRLNPAKQNFYIEAEGFTAYRESPNNFDTVLVITRFTRYDTLYNCLRSQTN